MYGVVTEAGGAVEIQSEVGRGTRILVYLPAAADDLDCPPALVLSDAVMPGGSGPELIRELQARWPGTRALLMSGYAGDVADDAMANLDLLQTPFTARQLLIRVRHAIDGRP